MGLFRKEKVEEAVHENTDPLIHDIRELIDYHIDADKSLVEQMGIVLKENRMILMYSGLGCLPCDNFVKLLEADPIVREALDHYDVKIYKINTSNYRNMDISIKFDPEIMSIPSFSAYDHSIDHLEPHLNGGLSTDLFLKMMEIWYNPKTGPGILEKLKTDGKPYKIEPTITIKIAEVKD